jgi:hypothetical protein
VRRCPTCRADSPKLVHFGIYLCPTCGPIDADGHAVAPPPGLLLTPAAAPRVYESLQGAAPTPVADDTQPNPIAFPPPVPGPAPAPLPGPMAIDLAPPRPVPLDLAPPRPTPLPGPLGAPSPFPIAAPRPVPAAAAPPHPRASSPDPLTVVPPASELSCSSFAPPPPRDPRDLITTGSGPPRILVISLAVFTVLSFVELAVTSQAARPGQACGVVLQLGSSLAILSGRRWARNASLFVNGLGFLFTVILMLLPIPTLLRVVLAVSTLATGWWIYVLLRRDVVDYCRQ